MHQISDVKQVRFLLKDGIYLDVLCTPEEMERSVTAFHKQIESDEPDSIEGVDSHGKVWAIRLDAVVAIHEVQIQLQKNEIRPFPRSPDPYASITSGAIGCGLIACTTR